MKPFAVLLPAILLLTLAGCGGKEAAPMQTDRSAPTAAAVGADSTPFQTETTIQTGLIAEQILSGAEGDIHYSCYLPESYDGSRKFPMMVVMPGYDRMWLGEESSGSNLNWSGFTAWTKLDTEMIVVSTQLTDWRFPARRTIGFRGSVLSARQRTPWRIHSSNE